MTGLDIWKRLRPLGLPGVLGLALLGVAAWVHWQWLPVQQDEVNAQASRVRHMRATLRTTRSVSMLLVGMVITSGLQCL